MKLQTRVRQMLQWHFSFSKLTACCVFNHLLCCLLLTLQHQEYQNKLLHDPKENLLRRRTGCRRIQQAEQNPPVQGQMAATLLLMCGKQSSSAEALCIEIVNSFLTGTFPDPSIAVQGFPAGLPCLPGAGFLSWHIQCAGMFPARELLSLQTESRFCVPRAGQLDRDKCKAWFKMKL